MLDCEGQGFNPPNHVCLAAQAMVESLLKEYPNVLTLRVRMPIVQDLTYHRNFITKIIKYEKASSLFSYVRHCL